MSIVYLSLLGWVPLMMLLLVVLVVLMLVLVLVLVLLLLPAPTLLLECFSLPSSIYGVCVCYVSLWPPPCPCREAGCLTGPLAHNHDLNFDVESSNSSLLACRQSSGQNDICNMHIRWLEQPMFRRTIYQTECRVYQNQQPVSRLLTTFPSTWKQQKASFKLIVADAHFGRIWRPQARIPTSHWSLPQQ